MTFPFNPSYTCPVLQSYFHPLGESTSASELAPKPRSSASAQVPAPTVNYLAYQLLIKKQLSIRAPMPLTKPPPAILSTRNEPTPFIPSMNPTTAFTLTTVGFLSPKIKCQSENKKESYTFQSRSDSVNCNVTVKDHAGNQVCKVKNKGEHLLDLYLTTDSKDINVQFRDMIAFKKAVEKNGGSGGLKMPIVYQPSDDDDDRTDPRYFSELSASSQNVCWAFEFEGRIYQWTAISAGHSIHAPPGSDVLVCHSTSSGPATKVAKLASSHTGASDKLLISNASTASVIDKTGLQILLLTSVLCLMEIINDRSRDLADFE
ncbi:hypothetical protein EDD11_001783 [Mortierella claussenii]|nr:hypothetical protein EDD11_001783 [Mortierella claussenii]